MDTGAPTSSHYVDKVQVNISGVTHDMTFTSQPAPTFVVQYDMGEITDTPTVQARAECTVHGWSGWTSPQTVPEFSLVSLLPMLAVLAVAVLFLHSKIRNPK